MAPSATAATWLALILAFLSCLVDAEVVQVTGGNLDEVLKGSEVAFVNFYADWCRFSQQLKPIFAEAAEKFKDVPRSRIVWAAVDSDRNQGIAGKYHVSKYPTLKLFRNGELVKKEYRSQRSVEALTAYVQKQLDSGVQEYTDAAQLKEKIDPKKRNVVGAFAVQSGAEFDNFKKISAILREDCVFHQGPPAAGAPAMSIQFHGQNAAAAVPYPQDMANFDQLKAWLTDKCVPVVREITFENAEELTEEGLPFLILFKHPDDQESTKVFTDAVIKELPDQKTAINCLVADGKRFAHPLHHLGKAEKDLPVIAIDSFRHMYLFEGVNALSQPGKLRQFVLDLHSGKLHREFHHGPDHPVVQTQVDPNGVPETEPPPSVFDKLKPSHTRYSILRKEEL